MSVIDDIKSKFPPEYISDLAIELGESESGVSKAIKALLPAVLNGLANACDNPEVVTAVYNAQNQTVDAESADKTAAIILSKNNHLITSVKEYSNISFASVEKLFAQVLEACMLCFGKCSAEKNIAPTGIGNLLSEQKGLIAGMLPPGLSVKTLDLDETAPLETEIKTDPTHNAPTKETKLPVEQSSTPAKKNSKKSFWRWLLPLILMGLAAWFLWNEYLSSQKTTITAPVAVPSPTPKDTVKAVIKDTLQTADSTRINNP